MARGAANRRVCFGRHRQQWQRQGWALIYFDDFSAQRDVRTSSNIQAKLLLVLLLLQLMVVWYDVGRDDAHSVEFV